VPKEQEKPKIEPKIAMVKPPPIDERERARRKAQKQLTRSRTSIADPTRRQDLTPLETKNLSGSSTPTRSRALAHHLQGRGRQRRHHFREQQPRLRHRGRLAHGHDTTAVTSASCARV